MGSQVHFCSLVVCDQNISAAGELWLGCSLMATSTMSLVFQKLCKPQVCLVEILLLTSLAAAFVAVRVQTAPYSHAYI